MTNALTTVAAPALLASLVALAGCSAASDANGGEVTGVVRSAIVGGGPSTAAEDFAVVVGVAAQDADTTCGGILVAPNVVVTARHCVAPVTNGSGTLAAYECLPSGEPPPGGGGFVTGSFPAGSIRVVSGVDAGGRWNQRTSLDIGVGVKEVVDDGSATLCSHDIAVLVLDKPVTGMPIAKMRLHKRPATAERFAIAGWGEAEDFTIWPQRRRRDDVVVTAVGPARFEEFGAHPRIFESTLGACFNDSGGPVFDAEAGAAVGIVVRGNGFSVETPRSPCLTPGATISNIVLADFGVLLHRAFEKAAAEPRLESREKPGWAEFGEVCALDAECGSNVCLKEGAVAKCNLDCAANACPGGFTCDGKSKRCVTPAAAATPNANGAGAGDEPPPVSARADDCAVVGPLGTPRAGVLGASAALVGLALAALVRRRRGRGAGGRTC